VGASVPAPMVLEDRKSGPRKKESEKKKGSHFKKVRYGKTPEDVKRGGRKQRPKKSGRRSHKKQSQSKNDLKKRSGKATESLEKKGSKIDEGVAETDSRRASAEGGAVRATAVVSWKKVPESY